MSRSRNIKPGFFMDDEMFHVGPDTKLLFIGLWTLADRLGILENRPARIGACIYPSHDLGRPKEIERMIGELCKLGKIVVYNHSGASLIYIKNFVKHQNPHPKEKDYGFQTPEQLNLIASRETLNSDKKQCSEELQGQQFNSTASRVDSLLLNDESGIMKDESNAPAQAPAKRRKKSTDPSPEAIALIEVYKSRITGLGANDGLRNLQKLLNEGIPLESLQAAVSHYGAHWEQNKDRMEYPYHLHNFFGKKGYWKDWITPPKTPAKETGASKAGYRPDQIEKRSGVIDGAEFMRSGRTVFLDDPA